MRFHLCTRCRIVVSGYCDLHADQPSSSEYTFLKPIFLEHPHRERGTIASTAIENESTILIRSDLIGVTLKDAACGVLGNRNKSPPAFVSFAYVNQSKSSCRCCIVLRAGISIS